MTTMTGAKACVESLRMNNVGIVFGIPGGAILPVYDELKDSSIRHVLTRHEQGASHMADGYARATGKVGVCMATSGPGATNMVTGIGTAYMDSSPIIAITGQVPQSMVGRDAFQEADIVAMTTPIVKHSFQPATPNDIPYMLKAAFHIANTGRPGPVVIDIPRNVQVGSDEIDLDPELHLPGYKPPIEPHVMQMKKAAELLVKATRPIILAGGGVLISNASAELIALAEAMSLPVATTFPGKGVFPENHPLAFGKIGLYGGESANHAICEADVILAVGCRFSDRSTVTIEKFASSAKIIHVDVDPSEIGKNVPAEVPIVGDAKLALSGIYNNVKNNAHKADISSWLKRVEEIRVTYQDQFEDTNVMNFPKALKTMRKILPPETVVTADVGLHQMAAAIYFDSYTPRSFISSGGLAPMGFAFPASIGAKAARPEAPVVCITGDGGFMMTQSEMATSIEEQLPVLTVVFNNHSLGMVAELQKLFWKQRYFAVDLGKSPDFVKLAEAYGAEGYRADSYKTLEESLHKAMRSEISSLIEIPISPEETLPLVPPGKTLDASMIE
ncbi:MAG: biosynthetic-type acetolactate synthase large subunit [Candidatus Bathyarchaeia archaeon]